MKGPILTVYQLLWDCNTVIPLVSRICIEVQLEGNFVKASVQEIQMTARSAVEVGNWHRTGACKQCQATLSIKLRSTAEGPTT